MDIGQPVKTIISEPKTIPVPQWQPSPEREPAFLPQEQPVERPEKVNP